MSTIHLKIPVPQEVTIEEARSQMEKMLPALQERFEEKVPISDIKTDWNKYNCMFAFRARGYVINGNMIVGHNAVEITGELPFLVSFYRGTIEEAITNEATALLNT